MLNYFLKSALKPFFSSVLSEPWLLRAAACVEDVSADASKRERSAELYRCGEAKSTRAKNEVNFFYKSQGSLLEKINRGILGTGMKPSSTDVTVWSPVPIIHATSFEPLFILPYKRWNAAGQDYSSLFIILEAHPEFVSGLISEWWWARIFV